jgi:hypothetical protein
MTEKDPVLMVTYTDGRSLIHVTGMDRRQAMTVLGIMEQTEPERHRTAQKLAKALAMALQRGVHITDMNVGVSITTAGGLVTALPHPINGRIGHFVVHAARSKNSRGVEILNMKLKEFIGGANPGVVHPFRIAEVGRVLNIGSTK